MNLMHGIAKQMRQPRGILGRMTGYVLSRSNRKENLWVVSLLNIQPDDCVLEIGFGPGLAIQSVSAQAYRGWVAGIDFSEEMVRQARQRNAKLIAAGRVELRHGDVASLPFDTNTFDKAFAIHVFYFLNNPLKNLKEIWRVLKPGGRVAISVMDKDDMLKRKHTRTGIFTIYSGEEVAGLLRQSGFEKVYYEIGQNMPHTGICILAEKPE